MPRGSQVTAGLGPGRKPVQGGNRQVTYALVKFESGLVLKFPDRPTALMAQSGLSTRDLLLVVGEIPEDSSKG